MIMSNNSDNLPSTNTNTKPLLETFKFTGDFAVQAKKELNKYPENRQRSALLALLHLAQKQNTKSNCITPAAISYISRFLNIPELRVYEVVTFYTMFRLTATGKYHIQVCGTTSCMLCGAHIIKKAILDYLNLKENEVSKDGLFTVTEVECLGACVDAPVIQVNDDYCQKLSVDSAIELIKNLKENNLSMLKLENNRPSLPLTEIKNNANDGTTSNNQTEL